MSHSQLDLFDPSFVHPVRPKRRSRRNELLEVMHLTMIVCRRELNDYSCPKSRHTFTQPQLLACLILKVYRKLTYRGVIELLEASDGLREVLGLETVPAHTTLAEFSKRVLTPELLDRLVGQVLQLMQERGLVVGEVAIDSTGIETSSASAHFIARSRRKLGGYIKLSLAVACTSLALLGVVISVGPTNDLSEATELLWRTSGRCRPDFLFADAGYDAERVHQFSRGWSVLSYIPPVPKSPSGRIKTGEGRLRCERHRPHGYGRRWHVESFISGMKRTCGSTLRARSQMALKIEAGLKALAYAIRR